MVQHIRELAWNVPSDAEVVLLVFVLAPLQILVHELGHALAALRLTRSDVFVRIRAKERRWSARVGRLLIEAGPSGVPVRGFCLFDRRGLARVDLAAIIVAGPLASLLGAVTADELAQHSAGAVRDVCSIGAIGGYLVAVVNMAPFFFRRNGTIVATDGFLTLAALFGRRTAPGPRAPLPDAQAEPIAARWAAPGDAPDERRAGSMPPPGFSRD